MHLARAALGFRRGPVTLDLEARAASAAWADDANTARADGWFVADLAARVDVRTGTFTFRPTAGVENLFDETYVGAVAVNGAAGRYYEPAPGRTFYVGVEVR
jgi:iron complex outermembrane receptor protein